ncbi:hypothetical protein [Bradyrhizobium sp. McL0616]|uniref:hypothetical protein n=1 Tax=Bradyrhizobium sp. McL0616 TaxID=3415674 RepID=UPI003CEE79EF
MSITINRLCIARTLAIARSASTPVLARAVLQQPIPDERNHEPTAPTVPERHHSGDTAISELLPHDHRLGAPIFDPPWSLLLAVRSDFFSAAAAPDHFARNLHHGLDSAL